MATAAAATRAINPTLTHFTSGRCRSSRGVGFTTPVADHADVMPILALLKAPFWTSRATMITTKKTTFWNDGVPVLFQRTVCSTTPNPRPAANATGSDSILATTAAARPGSSTVGPFDATPGATPLNGAL